MLIFTSTFFGEPIFLYLCKFKINQSHLRKIKIQMQMQIQKILNITKLNQLSLENELNKIK